MQKEVVSRNESHAHESQRLGSVSPFSQGGIKVDNTNIVLGEIHVPTPISESHSKLARFAAERI